ncbi:hypothetical protein GCM10010245_90080 [Streptomyces spectabilis]|uniref:Muramoyltetrapeptide carboxypeptidase LdcA involved in peptidoglycan recycling n=1 Tax=Streptomyces spectabilis TaxID=68270 RepID=A0A7W8B3Q8_STRST|nr:muramoyltetrapeptide carboxypeptidase LdcA involved in peptidoglycan recycling [Streptomyces spectabilis]GGV57030.1 hypothetical protein GCM10010245_90080 [Streptomyces spectabilis]
MGRRETAIDLLPLLDWDRLREAEPTWLVGFSDMPTLITPMTLLTGTATVHGNNLMDTPYRVPEGLRSWLGIVAAPPGAPVHPDPPGRHRATGFDDFAAFPDIREYTLDSVGAWTRLDGSGDVEAEGRLIGGCIETLCNPAGTAYLDVSAVARNETPDGLLVYVEAAGDDAFAIYRNLHGMRLAGFFDRANAVLVGRTSAPENRSLSQHEAVLDALGSLNVPVIADIECGHVPPYIADRQRRVRPYRSHTEPERTDADLGLTHQTGRPALTEVGRVNRTAPRFRCASSSSRCGGFCGSGAGSSW